MNASLPNVFFYSFVLLETGDSRPILRRLDRVIGLPEETALMLRDYEYTLFRHTSVDQLLKGLAKVLNRPQYPSDKEKKHIQDVCHFQKIVSHFYLVRKKYMYIVRNFMFSFLPVNSIHIFLECSAAKNLKSLIDVLNFPKKQRKNMINFCPRL